MSVFDTIVRQSGQVLQSRAADLARGAAKAAVGTKYGAWVDVVANNLDVIRSRDWNRLAENAINSGVFTSRLPWLSGVASSGRFEATDSRAMGGVTPVLAKRIVQETLETNFGRRNLFMFDISSGDTEVSSAGGYSRLNLFVLEASYGVNAITAEAHKVGGSTLDQPTGTDPMELRLTTLDDETGYVKQWFEDLRSRVARRDGTFGVPSDYLVRMRLLHAFVTDEAAAKWLRAGTDTTWSMEAWFRPVSMELDLSRRDQSLEEITLTFHQYDTHYK